jgi:hypothetical protein
MDMLYAAKFRETFQLQATIKYYEGGKCGSHCSGYEEFCLLGYNAVQFVESQTAFLKNVTPPSSV